jgi:MFS family permease
VKNRSALGILFLVVFVDLLGFGMVIPVMPLYAERLGASEAWTGLLSTGYSAMQFVFAPIWGRLSDRIGRRPVLIASIAATAVAFLLYGLAGASSCCSSRGSSRGPPPRTSRSPAPSWRT